MRLGIGAPLVEGARDLVIGVNTRVGPVWIPMALVSLRVGWLSLRAFRTRRGVGALGRPVRPELTQLAPLFAALGLCGTVLGLITSFSALGEGEFLTQVPLLLGGLGTAMTSTLVGLSLQIGTLLLGVINPAWSLASLAWSGNGARVRLDGRELGIDEDGVRALVAAVSARQPEALALRFERGVPGALRDRVRESLWRQLDGSIPVRELAR